MTMKLTDFLCDVGRPIAYYPKLKRITGSTNATVFLCQFIYWVGKGSDVDGWIFKTSNEIEDETGLSYYEQKTARALLVKNGLMEEKYARLDHQMYFRPNLEVINNKWGNAGLSVPESDNPSFGNEATPNSLNSITETTTETTTEKPKVKKSLPANSGMDWMVAAGVSAEEMTATNDKIVRETETANFYEFCMGYNPLNWQDKDMPELLRFLMTKSPEEIKAFAKWSRKEYSTFPPTKARQFPLRVKEFWPLAFGDAENTAPPIPKFIPPADDEKKFIPNPNPRRQW